MNMNLNYVKLMKNIFNPQFFSRAAYSQKDKFNPEAFDRLLRELDNTITKYHGKHGLAPIPNWELLTPRGYRFFLPNNVGVGWHDVRTGPYSLRKEFDFMSCDFKCFAQECPLLLRQSVSELFPGANLTYSRLTVLTLSPKNVKQTTENEMEDAVKMFVLTAQEICKKIINEGYWADFINPFSGLPGASTPKVQEKLYETDPRFRGVGFRIFKRQKCLIIDDKKTSQFKGHIFTTAPPQSKRLKQILYFIDYDLDLFESDNVAD